MSVSLREDIEKEIIGLLIAGKCSELRDLLRKIGESYKAIDNFFKPSEEFIHSVRIVPENVLVASRCLDEKELRIEVRAYVSISSRYGEGDGRLLCSDIELVEDELDEDEYYMIVEVNDPEHLRDVLTRLMHADHVNWKMLATGVVPGNEIDKIFQEKPIYDYYVKLLQPKLIFDLVTATFHGKISVGSATLYVHSYLLHHGLFPDKDIDSVVKLVGDVYEKYYPVGPKIELVLIPGC